MQPEWVMRISLFIEVIKSDIAQNVGTGIQKRVNNTRVNLVFGSHPGTK